MQRRLNQADKALGVAAILFVICLLLKIYYPQSIYIKGLLFCAEAALIGGIADWFAVTALFKKPLGFPYHTEIIPRKREQVIEGCIKLVQKEFFTKKQMLLWSKEGGFIDYILAYVEKNNFQKEISRRILDYFEQLLSSLNAEALAMQLDMLIHEKVQNTKLLPQVKNMMIDFINSEKGSTQIDILLKRAIQKVEEGAINDKVKAYLEEYLEEKSQGLLSMMMMFVAKQSNVLNVDEIAQTVQAQLIYTLTEMRENHNHQMRRALIDELKNSLHRLPDNIELCQSFESLKLSVFSGLQTKQLLKELIESIIISLKRPESEENALVRQGPLVEIITTNVENALYTLKNDIVLKRNLESYLQDVVGRALLEGRNMMAVIIRDVLEGLTKEELNRLIYEKVEEDLIWIRMNGCIVGASIGCIIFIGLHLVG